MTTNLDVTTVRPRRTLRWTIGGTVAVVAVGLLIAQSSLSAPTEEKAGANGRPTETFATIEPATLRFVASPVDTDAELFFGCGDGSNGYYAPQSPKPLIEW